MILNLKWSAFQIFFTPYCLLPQTSSLSYIEHILLAKESQTVTNLQQLTCIQQYTSQNGHGQADHLHDHPEVNHH